MSFMRLLTAGRSWVGMQEPTSRYQMTDPRSMPKFGGKKNPFRKKGEEVASGEEKHLRLREPQRQEESIGLVTSDSLRSEDALRLAEPQSEQDVVDREEAHDNGPAAEPVREAGAAASAEAPEPEPGPMSGGEAPKAESGEPTRPAGSLKQRISTGNKAGEQARAAVNRLKALASRVFRPIAVRMPKQARAAAERRAIQTELSLDNVKVIRNDLADADFEMVSAVPRRVRASKPLASRPRRAAERDEPAALLAESPEPAGQTMVNAP